MMARLLGSLAKGADCEALVRQLARLQVRISDLVLTHRIERNRLEAQVIRLRAGLIVGLTERFRLVGAGRSTVDRTEVPAGLVPDQGPLAAPENLRQAREVICETGCQGHAHPWLQDGPCQLSGHACQRAVHRG